MNVSLKRRTDVAAAGDAPLDLKRCSKRLGSPTRGGMRRQSRPRSRFVEPACRARSAPPVGERARGGCPSATGRGCGRARARAAACRGAPVVGEELALETRDVDADRTLGLAGAALEAEVEHLAHALVAEAGFAEPAGHRQPQRRWPARASSAPPRASPCTTGTSCRRASCGRRRGRCTSRRRRPSRRTRGSRRTSPAAVSGSRRRSAGSRSAAARRRSCRG